MIISDDDVPIIVVEIYVGGWVRGGTGMGRKAGMEVYVVW